MAKRRPIISGNWKMHLDRVETTRLIQQLDYILTDSDYDAVDVSLHPAFTSLSTVWNWIQYEKKVPGKAERPVFALGAQNCHFEESGAFTGEISPGMLTKLDIEYVIIGHSERRQFFGETDDWVNKKVKAVLAHGMTPIMCCGETEAEYDAGDTESKVSGQVRAGLAGLKSPQVAGLVVAYEPIWAIGTGKTASPDDAQKVCRIVRETIRTQFDDAAADAVRVQYGGSVKPNNIAELMSQRDIDGALVGGAALSADDFGQIVQYRHQAV